MAGGAFEAAAASTGIRTVALAGYDWCSKTVLLGALLALTASRRGAHGMDWDRHRRWRRA